MNGKTQSYKVVDFCQLIYLSHFWQKLGQLFCGLPDFQLGETKESELNHRWK